MENKFFNSKLNSAFLLILIVLMIVALYFMFKNQEVYLPSLVQSDNNIEQNIKGIKCEISGAKENLADLSVEPCFGLNYSVMITGKIKGNYFFEGSAPVRIEDSTGAIVYKSYLKATSEWMTTDYVSFEMTIGTTDINPNIGGDATIIIERDDPSGEGKNLMPIRIPVVML